MARKKSSVDVSLLAEGEESSMEETEEVRGDDEPESLGGSFEEAGNGTACVQQVKIESDEETIEVVRNAGYATRYPQDVVVDGPATQWHLERPVTQRRLEQRVCGKRNSKNWYCSRVRKLVASVPPFPEDKQNSGTSNRRVCGKRNSKNWNWTRVRKLVASVPPSPEDKQRHRPEPTERKSHCWAKDKS